MRHDRRVPGRSPPIHGYRISQLVSPVIDPAEILHEYETTKFPDRFYHLKIGISWADAQNRLDTASVLARCGRYAMLDRCDTSCSMGIDTGKDLHVVVSRFEPEGKGRRQIVYLGVHRSYEELDALMERFHVRRAVIDAMPEVHATRAFAARHRGRVWLNYFVETQRGRYQWDEDQHIVRENRTEALDASRQVIRDRKIVLPRQTPIVAIFAEHLSHDAKRLEEDEKTGAQAYRYVKLGVNHFSFAFTYDCIAWSREHYGDNNTRVGVVRWDRRGILGPW